MGGTTVAGGTGTSVAATMNDSARLLNPPAAGLLKPADVKNCFNTNTNGVSAGCFDCSAPTTNAMARPLWDGVSNVMSSCIEGPHGVVHVALMRGVLASGMVVTLDTPDLGSS